MSEEDLSYLIHDDTNNDFTFEDLDEFEKDIPPETLERINRLTAGAIGEEQ